MLAYHWTQSAPDVKAPTNFKERELRQCWEP